MSLTLLAALLVQAVSLLLLRHRLGRGWLRRPVTLFMLASTVELGVAPALLTIPSISAADNFTLGISRSFTGQADLIMSLVMLGFAVAYLLTRPERVAVGALPCAAANVARVLDWRVLAAACVPLIVLTVVGRGYNSDTTTGVDASLGTSLVSTFFVVVIATASAAFLLRHGARWFLPVLILQSVMLAIAGERTPVLMDALALILILLFAGIRLRRRQLAVAALLAVTALLAISGVRAEQGRAVFYASSGLAGRVSALGDGLFGGGSAGSDATPGLLTQFAVREADVDFAGGILQSLSEGQPRLSPGYVPKSLLLAVPSFLWEGKLDRGTALNPAQLEIDNFGLQQTNYIPGAVGLYLGFLSLPGLLVLFGLLGLIFGFLERWLLRECTPARVILLAGAVVAALWYEAGPPEMLVQLRAAVVLALVFKAVEVARYGRGATARSRRLLPPPQQLSSRAGLRARG